MLLRGFLWLPVRGCCRCASACALLVVHGGRTLLPKLLLQYGWHLLGFESSRWNQETRRHLHGKGTGAGTLLPGSFTITSSGLSPSDVLLTGSATMQLLPNFHKGAVVHLWRQPIPCMMAWPAGPCKVCHSIPPPPLFLLPRDSEAIAADGCRLQRWTTQTIMP